MAGGTGDIAFRMAEKGALVTVSDINPDMLKVGMERAESRREQDSRQITNRRDDQISEIVQRLARVETQGAAVVEALNRLADRLDRQQRRGDLLPGYRLKAAKE